MLSTARAVSSPACAAQQHGRCRFVGAPRRRVVLAGDDGRRAAAAGGVRALGPRSVAARGAGSSNPAVCLEAAAPWRMDDVAAPVIVSYEESVRQVVLKQAALAASTTPRKARHTGRDTGVLDEAFDRCGAVCKEYAKTFYLATQLMTPERRRAIWAIYVATRRRLRRPALRHARRGAGRRRGRLPGRRRAAVPGHGPGDAHGPRQVPLRHLRRALPLLLPRGRHRRAHDRPRHGRLPGLPGGRRDGVRRCARPRRRKPAHQHPPRRRRGCEEGQDLPAAGRAGHGRHLRGRHLRRPCHRRVEELHEGTDREGQGLLPAGRARRRRAQPGEPMAGVGISASVPADPGRDRGQRLRQLQQEGLCSQGQEAGGAAQSLPQITHASAFAEAPLTS